MGVAKKTGGGRGTGADGTGLKGAAGGAATAATKAPPRRKGASGRAGVNKGGK